MLPFEYSIWIGTLRTLPFVYQYKYHLLHNYYEQCLQVTESFLPKNLQPQYRCAVEHKISGLLWTALLNDLAKIGYTEKK